MATILATGLSPELLALAALLAVVILLGLQWLFRRSDGASARSPRQASSPPVSKIERIKNYRERHGVGLKEAKEAIEAEDEGRPIRPHTPAVARAAITVEGLLLEDKKIEAIKLYREQHSVGLKEAKDAVEELERQSKRSGA